MIDKLRLSYISRRVEVVDADFLEFEEASTTPEDLEMISTALERGLHFDDNPHNSILLYVTGLTDIFDYQKGRSDTRGGTPPDIDLDFSGQDIRKLLDWIRNYWGEGKVAFIGTYMSLKPKSFTDKFFRVTAPKSDRERYTSELAVHQQLAREIREKIPDSLFGKEPTLEEIVYGNEEKGYPEHLELLSPKYSAWYEAAQKLGGIISGAGVHPAGIVALEEPLVDHFPVVYMKDEYIENGKKVVARRPVIQFDKDQIEELGGIKVDLLKTDNLALLRMTTDLVQEWHGRSIDLNEIPDDDPHVYDLMREGFLQGIFQMEASESPKLLMDLMQPKTLEELSALSAVNRPGPMQIGVPEIYAENKRSGRAPADMHPAEARILEKTWWTIIYQEQVMSLCSELAGFSLKESDDIRRAMGKKNTEKLKKHEDAFVDGCVAVGLIDADYAATLWRKLMKYSDYAFNKSHSMSYSYDSSICAWLKLYYPLEFYTSLLSVKARKSSKDWGEKANVYLNEMHQFFKKYRGTTPMLLSPSINHSVADFTIHNYEASQIRAGLSCVRGLGEAAITYIIDARGDTPFKDIFDFLERVNKSKVTRKVFECLILAGCFDEMGYTRKELASNIDNLYDYLAEVREFASRRSKYNELVRDNAEIDRNNIQLLALRAKKKAKETLTTEENVFLSETKKRQPRKLIEEPVLTPKPVFERKKTVTLSISDILTQADILGLLLYGNPARIVYTDTTPIDELVVDKPDTIAGMVTNCRIFKDRNGRDMIIGNVSDGQKTVKFLVFAYSFRGWDDTSLLCRLTGRLKNDSRGSAFIVERYDQYKETL